jgi:hypothetical protein
VPEEIARAQLARAMSWTAVFIEDNPELAADAKARWERLKGRSPGTDGTRRHRGQRCASSRGTA